MECMFAFISFYILHLQVQSSATGIMLINRFPLPVYSMLGSPAVHVQIFWNIRHRVTEMGVDYIRMFYLSSFQCTYLVGTQEPNRGGYTTQTFNYFLTYNSTSVSGVAHSTFPLCYCA